VKVGMMTAYNVGNFNRMKKEFIMAIKHTFKYSRNTAKGIEERTETRELTARKAIQFHCLDCSGGFSQEVSNCVISTCPLYVFRPYQK
jgi:hypothetical protein